MPRALRILILTLAILATLGVSVASRLAFRFVPERL